MSASRQEQKDLHCQNPNLAKPGRIIDEKMNYVLPSGAAIRFHARADDFGKEVVGLEEEM